MNLARKKSIATHLRKACKDRQEAVFAVCLHIDINKIMQQSSILMSPCSVSQ